MTLVAVTFGDWRPSVFGTRSHYGHGSRAVCGSPRRLHDGVQLRDKCAKCLKIKKRRKGEYL